jgi:hypothetical protein
VKSKNLLFALLFFQWLIPARSFAQSVQAPVYKDSDWWKIKVEVRLGAGISKSGLCDELYSEYLVKVNGGKKYVFGLSENKQEEIDCPEIVADLFGIGQGDDAASRTPVSFPLTVGKVWNARYAEQIEGRRRVRSHTVKWVDLEFKATAVETIKTPKGALESFKIEVSGWPWGKQPPIYYYSPAAKTVVRSRELKERNTRVVTLVDYFVND